MNYQTSRLAASLDDQPLMQLAHLPTPLEPLARLQAKLQQELPSVSVPTLWIKRDDCTGLATGGNKTRKLEYLLGAAVSAGMDTLLTFGAVQSNHARQTAAACAHAGLACELLLTRRVPWRHNGYESAGNLLLDRLCGANITIVDNDAAKQSYQELTDKLQAQGRKVFVVPAGGSNAVGALGYCQALLELLSQCQTLQFQPSHVLHASASAGTQAGLVAAVAALRDEFAPGIAATLPAIMGCNVFHPAAATLKQRVSDLLKDIAPILGAETVNWGQDLIHVDSRTLGPGYGLPTAETRSAIELLAQTHGILLDPVYSGKAFASLLARIRAGEFNGDHNVVFLHTGGAAALSVYDNAWD